MADASRPIRHAVKPTTAVAWLVRLRFAIARRAIQFGTLLLFFGTAHWGWTIAGRPLLQGNLSAASLAGSVPLADPFAALQMLATGHLLLPEVWIGAAIVLVAYLLLGGRTFCAWACPLNVVTDAATWLRERLGLRDLLAIPTTTRYAVLALALVLSAATGVAAFEWVSPIGMLHRALVYGTLVGLVAVAGVLLLDLAVLRHGWCGHLCPLGAFWSLAGYAGVVKVRFDTATCTRCGDCVRVCPEPRVLNFNRAATRGAIDGGECTNCGRCVAICPEASLAFGIRPLTGTATSHPPSRGIPS
jgi:ferredoxin-type protein NapH